MIMKKLILSFMILSTLLISCGKDSGTDDPNDPKGNGGEQTTLTISPNELTFKSEGEEKTFSIASNFDWIITNPSTWCKINPPQGNGNSTITAIADPSDEYDDRNFNLTIKAGETTKVMTVTQKKKDAIILTKEKYDIPTEGDNITVEVKSNISYSTIIPEEHNEWIKQVETKQLGRGLETKNLNFEISANPTTDKREGIIIIKDNSSYLADTIHVYQAQKNELILTQDTYNVSSEGENINVELRSNVDYEVIIPEDVKDWVNRITSRSSRVDNLIFNIAANPTYDNRSTKVIIKDKNSELADTLNINQTQVNAIILTQEKYEIPSEGQNIKIEVKSNIKYDIIIPDNAKEWIKQIQSRALITNIINLSISENTSYEQRAAEIVVKDKNSNLSDTIRITQKQNNTIILTQKKYDIPAEGQQISIEIKSNIEYDILLSSDAEKWIEKIDLSRALITNTLNYNILPNTTYNERKAEIIIKDKGSDLSDTVVVAQATGLVDQPGDLQNVLVENAHGVGIGQHQPRHIVSQHRLQGLQIHAAVGGGGDVHHLIAAHGGGGGIGAVGAVGNDDLGALMIAPCIVILLDQQHAGELAVSAGGGLEGHAVHAGDLAEIAAGGADRR